MQTPEEFGASLRRHIEAAADLAALPELQRAAFWRIVEWQAAIAVRGYALDVADAMARLCEDTARDGGTAWDAAAAIRGE